MPDPNFVILYVENPLASTAFYAGLLGRAPVEASPTFVMYALEAGVMLGLWSRYGVAPAVTPPASTGLSAGGELAFTVADGAAVRTIHEDWVGRGLTIVQAPTEMEFGHTFVALDPDGHRLRVFAPAPA